MKKTQQEMEHLINSIPGGIAVYTVTDSITPVFCSEGVAALSGYTKEEYQALRGNDAFQVVYEEDRERVRAAVLGRYAAASLWKYPTAPFTRTDVWSGCI